MIRRARPGLPDAEMIAHVLLGAPHSEPVPAHLAADGPQRPAAAVRALARAVLDAPGLPARREPHGAQAGCRHQRAWHPPCRIKGSRVIEDMFDESR